MDFCSSVLNPRITSDKPSVDGFEVTNLMTNYQTLVTKNFVCESFVRPPANVVINFPVPVDIAYIIINPKVGERRSKGFSIFTKTGECTLEESILPKQSASDHFKGEEKEDFCLGKWFCNTESKIILNNSQYKHFLTFPLPSIKKNASNFVGSLKHSNRLALSDVKRLTVRILSVVSTGPPVLGQIQVWGQPSLTSSPSQKRKMILLWTQQTKQQTLQQIPLPKFYNSEDEHKKSIVCENIPNKIMLSGIDDDVPEEFLDLLTCEIMTIPILLPSGNSIDMFSLEKYTAHEAIWGRPASDPFTGIIFKDHFRPEPNVHLKARIDRYLLLNEKLPPSHKGMGRTLASTKDHREDHRVTKRKNNSNGLGDSRDLKIKKVVTKNTNLEINLCQETFEKSYIKGDVLLHKNKETSLSSSIGCQKSNIPQITKTARASSASLLKTSSYQKPTSVTDVKRTGHSLIYALGNAVTCTAKKQSQAEVKFVKSSINSSVQFKVTSKLASNTPLPRPPSLKEGVCKNNKEISLEEISSNSLTCVCGSRGGTLYSLACSHNLCSSCIGSTKAFTSKTIQCKECDKISSKHQVKRVHPKSVFAVSNS